VATRSGNLAKLGVGRAAAVQLYERDLLAGNLRGYRTGRRLSVADAIKELRGFDLVCSAARKTGFPVMGMSCCVSPINDGWFSPAWNVQRL